MTEKQISAIEELGWTITEESDGYYLARQSDAGEDFGFSVSKENWRGDIAVYYDGFDPEEHATMWYEAKRRGDTSIPGLRALLNDADEINNWLEELAFLVM